MQKITEALLLHFYLNEYTLYTAFPLLLDTHTQQDTFVRKMLNIYYLIPTYVSFILLLEV